MFTITSINNMKAKDVKNHGISKPVTSSTCDGKINLTVTNNIGSNAIAMYAPIEDLIIFRIGRILLKLFKGVNFIGNNDKFSVIDNEKLIETCPIIPVM